MMKIKAGFEGGTYNLPCELFKKIMVGSVHCTGHEIIDINKCKYCESYEENESYILPISKEKINIVSSVNCIKPFTQYELF